MTLSCLRIKKRSSVVNFNAEKLNMNTILKLEEAAQFAVCLWLFSQLQLSWWWFGGLILAPDIGMLGYALNKRIGAWTYNIFHHKGLAVALGALGYFTGSQGLMLSGIILYGHASMDRIFGYGLKYNDSFHHTHLGWLKQKAS